MAESPRTGRLASFTLRDVPREIRLRAADRIADDEPHREHALLIALVAANPSPTRYWLPAHAVDAVLGKTRT